MSQVLDPACESCARDHKMCERARESGACSYCVKFHMRCTYARKVRPRAVGE
jgi:hypothetical protein